jgi:hypothetical protein
MKKKASKTRQSSRLGLVERKREGDIGWISAG